MKGVHKDSMEGLNSNWLKGIYSNDGLKDIYIGYLRYAFSLIELSIVLIIIGLLVAGVTGGKSLIESAKQRAFINELNNWKQNVYIFYASRGRLPGDIDNDGMIGAVCDGCDDGREFYDEKREGSSINFGGEYQGKYVGAMTGPFVDLYLEGASDFKPKICNELNEVNGYGYANYKYANLILPIFNSIKDYYLSYFTTFKNIGETMSSDFTKNIDNGIYLKVREFPGDDNTHYSGYNTNNGKIIKSIDEKIDDGNYQGGILRAHCSRTSVDAVFYNYNTALKNKYSCHTIYYRIY